MPNPILCPRIHGIRGDNLDNGVRMCRVTRGKTFDKEANMRATCEPYSWSIEIPLPDQFHSVTFKQDAITAKAFVGSFFRVQSDFSRRKSDVAARHTYTFLGAALSRFRERSSRNLKSIWRIGASVCFNIWSVFVVKQVDCKCGFHGDN